MSYKNKIGIILTGYSIDKKQMEEHVKYFQENGFNNIVISSYRNYVSEILDKDIPIVYNEEIDGYKFEAKIRNKNYLNKKKYKKFNKSITDSETINLVFDIKDDTILKRYKGAFIIASTSIRGIEKMKQVYPKVEYVLRIRADAQITNLELINEKLLEKINQKKNDKFENLILVPGFPKDLIKLNLEIKWNNCDFWIFGNINDILKYYQKCDPKCRNILLENTSVLNEKYLITGIQDKWENFNNYFIINSDIQIYWEKQEIYKKFNNYVDIKYIFENNIINFNTLILYLYVNNKMNKYTKKQYKIFINSNIININNLTKIIIIPSFNIKKIKKIKNNIYQLNIIEYLIFEYLNVKTIFNIDKLKDKFKKKVIDEIDLILTHLDSNSLEYKALCKFKSEL